MLPGSLKDSKRMTINNALQADHIDAGHGLSRVLTLDLHRPVATASTYTTQPISSCFRRFLCIQHMYKISVKTVST